MLILGIETSCDETSASIVRDGVEVHSNVIISQIKAHKVYGGVVPEVASRKHTENISFVLDKCFKDANLRPSDMDAVAIANEPGLFGALVVGCAAAKTFSFVNDIPLIGINHVLGHLYGNYLSGKAPEFPYIALTVSGGHTFISKVTDHLEFEILGSTRDDAAGEAYDKVARFLGLGYPGGPIVDKLAAQGDDSMFVFPKAMQKDGYDFSFSGLKTAVINKVLSLTDEPETLSEKIVMDLCAGFQKSVVEILVDKTILAAKNNNINNIVVAGGVSANKALRSFFQQKCNENNFELFIPDFVYCTDNAAMIASLGFFKYKKGLTDDLTLKASPSFVF